MPTGPKRRPADVIGNTVRVMWTRAEACCRRPRLHFRRGPRLEARKVNITWRRLIAAVLTLTTALHAEDISDHTLVQLFQAVSATEHACGSGDVVRRDMRRAVIVSYINLHQIDPLRLRDALEVARDNPGSPPASVVAVFCEPNQRLAVLTEKTYRKIRLNLPAESRAVLDAIMLAE